MPPVPKEDSSAVDSVLTAGAIVAGLDDAKKAFAEDSGSAAKAEPVEKLASAKRTGTNSSALALASASVTAETKTLERPISRSEQRRLRSEALERERQRVRRSKAERRKAQQIKAEQAAEAKIRDEAERKSAAEAKIAARRSERAATAADKAAARAEAKKAKASRPRRIKAEKRTEVRTAKPATATAKSAVKKQNEKIDVPPPPSEARAENASWRVPVAALIGGVTLLFAVLLAVGALIAALGMSGDDALYGLIAPWCDALTGPMKDVFTFSGADAEAKQNMLGWGVGSLVYLIAGFALQALIRPKTQSSN